MKFDSSFQSKNNWSIWGKRFIIVIVFLLAVSCLMSLFTSISGHTSQNDVPSSASDNVRDRRKKRTVVLHPFLFAVFPALSLVSDNLALLTIDKSILIIASITLITNSIGLFLTDSIIKDRQKAGIIISISQMIFSSYGYIFDFLSHQIKNKEFGHRYLLLVLGGLEFLIIRFSIKSSKNINKLTEYLNLVSASLVTISLGQLIVKKITPQRSLTDSTEVKNWITSESDPYLLRDIYYIIVDSHASPKTLKDIYQYENDEFFTHLKKKGFFIADKSCSNYSMTMLSLLSSLNLDYVDSLGRFNGSDHNGIDYVKQGIEDNLAVRFIKSRGYRFIHMGSGFGITQKNRYADLNIRCGNIDETLARFVQSTLIRALADKTHLIENDKRDRVLCMFSQLAKIPKLKGPKFVFAHIACPQWPFIFNADGSPIHFDKDDTKHKRQAYLDQLTYIDKKIETLIDELLINSEKDPIIIIQADHGPNFGFDSGYELLNPPKEILLEKVRIFNAYYFPEGNYEGLYETITPVNTFRLIFNHYLSSNFPLVEDKSYYSTLDSPFNLINVSSLLQNN